MSNDKAVIEKNLTEILENICKVVGLHLAEWEMDKKLFLTLYQSENLTKAEMWCKEYDSLLENAKFTKVKISPKFYWFENLYRYKENKYGSN